MQLLVLHSMQLCFSSDLVTQQGFNSESVGDLQQEVAVIQQ